MNFKELLLESYSIKFNHMTITFIRWLSRRDYREKLHFQTQMSRYYA